MSENDVQAVSILRREVWNSLRSGEGMDQARADLARSRNAPWYNQVKDQQDSLFERLQSPADWEKARSSLWFQKEISYDPVPILQRVTVPALFIFGAEDRLVPVKDSVDAIKGVAPKAGFTIVVFPHADHTLHLVTAEGRGALSPEYLQQMQEWLARHVLLTK
jgi:pimeloyl-ACP methyl ester carboxylesterase